MAHKGVQLFAKHMKNNLIYSQCNSTMEDMMVGTCELINDPSISRCIIIRLNI